jgi:hypothetical protein
LISVRTVDQTIFSPNGNPTNPAANTPVAGNGHSYLLDTSAPLANVANDISTFAADGTTPKTTTLAIGDVIDVRVSWTEVIFVNGAPTLALQLGSAAATRQATYTLNTSFKPVTW